MSVHMIQVQGVGIRLWESTRIMIDTLTRLFLQVTQGTDAVSAPGAAALVMVAAGQ